MKVNFEELKTLIEAGDEKAFSQHIYNSMEKGDLSAAVTANTSVKSDLDSEKDKHHNTALETWKSNNLDTFVEAEIKKRNPDKTPAEIELETLRKQFEDSEKARAREKLMNEAIKQANEKGLPIDLLDFFVSEDEEKTTANLAKLEEVYNKAVQASVESKFKDNGRDIQTGGSGSPTTIKSIQEMAAEHNIRNQNN